MMPHTILDAESWSDKIPAHGYYVQEGEDQQLIGNE